MNAKMPFLVRYLVPPPDLFFGSGRTGLRVSQRSDTPHRPYAGPDKSSTTFAGDDIYSC